ncbi:MAG: phosphatidylglycerophosphatase A [Candidatus Thermoplasmatota archaeon]|nr:phosphatidylglycerophosphatase A [Candidatus Thermoplasmatota archaeon]MEC9332539.1 phosphatidylglycerophosphatase A [Candidatus Thermoplasmatota archaeon]MED6306079.1 phosphatidylglycerophosphatase A [Candidatus Thermoplasmatota archaeon]MEE3242636.1 phosphatidylglycerophosphatase A [Candidatus Thermoplasmatota archaeon]
MTDSKDLLREGIASFFFLGRAPVAPGTFGALGALGLAYLIHASLDALVGFLLLTLAGILYYVGLQVAPWCEEKFGKDPHIFVLDEVVGYLMLIGLLLILSTDLDSALWIVSFIAFRGFDVVKIWPAKDLEKMTGGHGIMLDDVAACFHALILVLLLDEFGILL